MKKINARWSSFIHALSNFGHRQITEETQWRKWGITLWKETTYIGCECGKCFYGKPTFDWK